MENAKEQANYGMLLGIAQIVERTEVYSSFVKLDWRQSLFIIGRVKSG
ncbi:MAG: hypothetical protein ACLUPL_05260 [Butyricimonas virosa]